MAKKSKISPKDGNNTGGRGEKYAKETNNRDGGDVVSKQSGEVKVCMNKQESGDGENEGSSEESEMNESASSDEVSEERHGSETGEGKVGTTVIVMMMRNTVTCKDLVMRS